MVLAAALHPLIKMSPIISKTQKSWWSACAVLRRSGVYSSLQPHGLKPARLTVQGESLGKSTGVGCHALLQGIFPTQASNPGLPNWRQILYHVSHQGSLTIGLTSNLNTADSGKTAPPHMFKDSWDIFTDLNYLGQPETATAISYPRLPPLG